MKNILITLILVLSFRAQAVPIVNENVANSGVMTIYPDDKDPHRFYIAPNVVMISKNKEGVPHFSYYETNRGLFKRVGLMQMTLVPAYTREEMEAAKQEILKKDAAAQFSGVPFIVSSLSLTGDLPEIIERNECDHVGGLVGQEQSCALVLTSKGRKLFSKALERKTLFTTLQFKYSIQAVIRKADGSYADQVISHGIAVRIDGEQLSNYPELININ